MPDPFTGGEAEIWDGATKGEYENHHLKCPIHGRTTPRGDVASCGCKPTIFWTTETGIEQNPQTDNMGLGHRGL